MRVAAAIVLVFVAGVWAESCQDDKDGTNEKIYYENCNTGEPLSVTGITLTHEDGSPNYPVDVDHVVILDMTIHNSGSQAYDNIVISAGIARYTDIFGICSWIGIPTFGLLDHLDGCNFGAQNLCPIKPGDTPVHDRLDLTPFQAIINLLSVSEPYQLSLSFKAGGQEISCATIEAKIRKG